MTPQEAKTIQEAKEMMEEARQIIEYEGNSLIKGVVIFEYAPEEEEFANAIKNIINK